MHRTLVAYESITKSQLFKLGFCSKRNDGVGSTSAVDDMQKLLFDFQSCCRREGKKRRFYEKLLRIQGPFLIVFVGLCVVPFRGVNSFKTIFLTPCPLNTKLFLCLQAFSMTSEMRNHTQLVV